MLLRTEILAGFKRGPSAPDPSAALGTSGRSGKTPFVGCLVMGDSSDVWQGKELEKLRQRVYPLEGLKVGRLET
jgi:hypothetical protein